MEHCRRKADQEDSARELYSMALNHKTYVFNELVKELRFAIQYFRERCEDARYLHDVASWPNEYKVTADAPYSSYVEIHCVDAAVHYLKSIRENPRADTQNITGRVLIKTNYHQSFWFEHEGKRLDVNRVARFLLAEMFRLVISE